MPEHPSFKTIRDNMIAQYGKEKGDNVYHAWLQKHGLDDTKSAPSEIPGGQEGWRERVTNLYEKRVSEVLKEEAPWSDWQPGKKVRYKGDRAEIVELTGRHQFVIKLPDGEEKTVFGDELRKEALAEAVKLRGRGRPRKFKSFRVTKRIERIAEQIKAKEAAPAGLPSAMKGLWEAQYEPRAKKIEASLKGEELAKWKAMGWAQKIKVIDNLQSKGHFEEDVSMATGGGATATMLPGSGEKKEGASLVDAGLKDIIRDLQGGANDRTIEARVRTLVDRGYVAKARKDEATDILKQLSTGDLNINEAKRFLLDMAESVRKESWRERANSVHKSVEGAKARKEFLKERFERIARRIKEAELALERQEARGNTSAIIKHQAKLEGLYKEMTLLSESHIVCNTGWHAIEIARVLKSENVDAEVKGDKVYFPKSQEGKVIQSLQKLKGTTPIIHQERATVLLNEERYEVLVRSQAPAEAWQLITSTLSEAYQDKTAEQVRQVAGHIWFKWMPKRGVMMERLNKETVLRAARESGFGSWKNRLERLHEGLATEEQNVNDPEEPGLPKLRVDSEVPDAGNRTVANLERQRTR